MALVESLPLSLGMAMPPFVLEDAFGKNYTSQSLVGEKGVLIVFTCNHCPYALAVWPRLLKIAAWAKDLGVETVAINPNIHPDYPQDDPSQMQKKVQEWGICFPYLVDSDQQVAKAFYAQCTPDIYLFDLNGALVYHGRIDDNWQDEAAVRKHELQEAIKALSEGRVIADKQYPSLGCSIKWKETK